MIWLEGLMLASVIYTAISATWSDCRSAIIPNTLILRSMAAFLVLDSVYYGLWGREYIGLFMTNLMGMAVIAFFFYAYHLWAAGDSKLLFVIGLGIPARLYSFPSFGPVPGFAILVLIFASAFLYIIADSLVCRIREKSSFHIKFQKINLTRMILSYLFMVAAMRLCNLGLMIIAGNGLYNHGFLITAIDFFIVLSLLQARDKVPARVFCIITAVIWGVLALLYLLGVLHRGNAEFDVKPWLLVLAVMLIRIMAERYNYQEVPTADLKERMILSAATILSFRTSRVQGLPTCMTEDLKARITKNQVDAIQRWKDSKQGKPSVVIVRKVPFAIFITAGTILFMMMEGLSLCHII